MGSNGPRVLHRRNGLNLDDARETYLANLAKICGLEEKTVTTVYYELINSGFIDYDVEKEILIGYDDYE